MGSTGSCARSPCSGSGVATCCWGSYYSHYWCVVLYSPMSIPDWSIRSCWSARADPHSRRLPDIPILPLLALLAHYPCCCSYYYTPHGYYSSSPSLLSWIALLCLRPPACHTWLSLPSPGWSSSSAPSCSLGFSRYWGSHHCYRTAPYCLSRMDSLCCCCCWRYSGIPFDYCWTVHPCWMLRCPLSLVVLPHSYDHLNQTASETGSRSILFTMASCTLVVS